MRKSFLQRPFVGLVSAVVIIAGVLLCGGQTAHAALSDGLRAYWSMDETNGTRYDSTANHNDLTDLNSNVGSQTAGQTISDGNGDMPGAMAGKSAYFSGGATEELVINPFTLGNASFTVAGWIYSYDQKGLLFSIPSNDGNRNFQLDIEWSSWFGNPGADVYIANGNSQVSVGNSITGWNFVVVEWDKATHTLRARANNQAWRTDTWTNSIPENTPSSLTLGNSIPARYTSNNVGGFDEVGLWDRSLSNAEVDALYNGGAGITYADIVPPAPTPTPASGGRTQTGTLVIQKVIVGGDPAIDPDDFTFTLDNEAARFSEAGTDTYVRPVGTHIVHEAAFPGYVTAYGGDCDSSGSVVLDTGTKTCIITNSAVPTPTPVPGSTPAPTPSIAPEPWEVTPGGTLEGTELHEGDTVSAAGSSDPDVYIVNTAGYKRLFLNPIIFSFYGHLGGFSQVKTITPQVRDSFGTSGLFRNCETNDQAVYAVEVTGEDTGILHHINITGDEAVAQDPDFFKKVFCINTREFDWYTKGADYSSLSQVPEYKR